MRNFAIVGLSNFGYFLTEELVRLGQYVVVVDTDEDRINRVKSLVQKAVIADASDRDTLLSLRFGEMDVVIVCLGDRIDASVLTTMHLRELGAKQIVVKAASEDHAKILKMVGATHIIFPEKDTAHNIAYSLSEFSVLDRIELAPGYSIIDFAPPESFFDKTLADLHLRGRYGVEVIVVRRSDPQETLFPAADFVVRSGDILVVMGGNDDLKRIQAF
ncbi:MAG: TrkA family potassium uptake protein [Candidatus Latescibacterota bacterium]